MVSISSSGGAWRTMITAPNRQIALPSFPSVPNSSSRKYEPKTAPTKTLNAPNGVTKIAGANAYAAKLQISPTPTVNELLVLPVCGQSEGADEHPYVWLCRPTIVDSSCMRSHLPQIHVVPLLVVNPAEDFGLVEFPVQSSWRMP